MRAIGLGLTHMFTQRPDLRARVDLYQHGRCANDEHAEIGDAEIHQEDVGAVSHVLTTQHDQRYLRNHTETVSSATASRRCERGVFNIFKCRVSVQRDILGRNYKFHLH